MNRPGAMGVWMPLYLKELRENRGFFLFLLAATVVVEALALQGAESGSDHDWPLTSVSLLKAPMYAMLALLPYTSALILAVILHISLTAEFKADTRYLLLSLPLPRSAILGTKFLAVVSVGACIFLISTTALYIVYGQVYDLWNARFPQMMDAAPTPASIWSIAGTGYFSVLLLALGLVSVAQAVRCAVRKYQGLATFGTFVGGIYLFAKCQESALYLLSGIKLAPIDAFATYAVVASLAFLLLGGWLFERHVEV